MAILTLLDPSNRTSLSSIISPHPISTTSPTPGSSSLITGMDSPASATIQTVTFGVVGTFLSIASLTLAYLQLRHQYRIYSRHIAAADPETSSHITGSLCTIVHNATFTREPYATFLLQNLEAQDDSMQSIGKSPPSYLLGPSTAPFTTPLVPGNLDAVSDLNIARSVDNPIDNECLESNTLRAKTALDEACS